MLASKLFHRRKTLCLEPPPHRAATFTTKTEFRVGTSLLKGERERKTGTSGMGGRGSSPGWDLDCGWTSRAVADSDSVLKKHTGQLRITVEGMSRLGEW